MIKIKLLCIMLAMGMLFTACGNKNNGNSALGNAASDAGNGISNGISDLENGVSDGMSDLENGLNDSRGDRDNDSIIGNGENESSVDGNNGLDNDTYDNNSDVNRNNESESALTGAFSGSIPTSELSALSNQKLGWGQGLNLDEKNRPLGSLDYQKKYGQYNAYFIGEDEKIIYLTFDEGWENGYTGAILDTLKEKQVPAVFFCTLDYIEKCPDLIQRMIDEGHAVGNHSDSHPSFPDISIEQCEQEIMNVHNYMLDNYQYEMNLFRAPAGEFSERVLAEVQSLGYKSVFWSYAYKDWEVNNQMGADKAYAKVTGALHNGAIYLLHAVSSDNAEILGKFIDEARAQGYEFKLFC